MAEPTPDRRKARLIAELADARQAFSRSFREVRRDADVGSHLKEGFLRHKFGCLAGATGFGWLIAVASRRKKKLPASGQTGAGLLKKTEKAGLVLMVLRFLFSVFKPTLISFLTSKAEEYGNRRRGSLPPPK